MATSIVIRTYHKDIEWLKLCLRSIEIYASGFRDVIVLFPEVDKEGHDWSFLNQSKCGMADFFAHAIKPVVADGYIDQQYSKMTADRYTDADEILFIDSDTILIRPTGPSAFRFQGKPYLLYTPYQLFPADTDMPWQAPTEKALSHQVAYEFMRRLPIMMKRELLELTRAFMASVHGVSLVDYLRNVKNREFSEFNVLGAYAYYHAPRLATFIPTDTPHLSASGVTYTPTGLPEVHARQFWSWGNHEAQMQEARQYLESAIPQP